MTETPIQVARVLMPEKGVFTVRCASPFTEDAEMPARGVRVIVNLDYGADCGELLDIDAYTPERDGPHPPGFTFTRVANDEDRTVIEQNEAAAREMRLAFVQAAQKIVSDIRVSYARLSFGKTRLFIRFVSDRQRPDLSSVQNEIRRVYGVSVHAWQMGPRDEVRVLGSVGPCGRACCCCTWQQKYPARPSAERLKGPGANPVALNGICGRYKCCLAFES